MIITLIVIFSLLLFAIFVPLGVEFDFSEKLNFRIKILGLKIFDIDSYQSKTSKKSKSEKQDKDENDDIRILSVIKTYFEVVCEMLSILYNHLKRKLKIKLFKFSIRFGLDDAATTGIFSGAVYTIVNVFYSYLLNNFNVKKHDVAINPDFNNKCFDVEFILKFNISIYWILCLLFTERKAIDKLLKIMKKDGVKNG